MNGNDTKPMSETFSYGSGSQRVELNTPLFLAPMAGSTEVSFRTICHRFGSGQGVTELVSARGIRYGGLETSERYLEIDPEQEGSVAIQLFGFDPYDFEIATRMILEDPLLTKTIAIDINMGCPVKKVRKTGAGASLMEDPKRAAKIVETTKRIAAAYDKPVSVKFRTCIEEGGPESLEAPEFAVAMAEAGADLITLHGRTAEQFYRGKADWSYMPLVRAALDRKGFNHVPLVGNGDINSAETLQARIKQGASQAYMIGRAAQAAPWIFAELRASLNNEPWSPPNSVERCQVIQEHFAQLACRIGEDAAAREFRSLLMLYLRGSRGAASWRAQAGKLTSAYDLSNLCRTLVQEDVWSEENA